MKRKIFAYLVLVYLITVIFLPVINASAKGSSDDWAGYWTYDKSVVIEYSKELASYYASNPDDDTRISYTADKNKIDYKFNYTGSGYNSELYDDAKENPGDYEYTTIILPGEHAYLNVALGNPDRQYRENGKISIPLSANIYDDTTYHFKEIQFSLIAFTHIYDKSKIDYNSEDMAANSRISERLSMPGGTSGGILSLLSPEDNQKIDNQTINGNAPYGINNGDIMVIEIDISFNSASSLVYYSPHGTYESNCDTIKIYHFYTWKYGAKGMILNTDAAVFPGEDNGVSVPAIIITGILGAGAALAAAAGSDGDSEGKRSTYKMYINKDFGDSIRYDKPPVTVYARMAEVTENGQEIDRPDLTSQISIFCEGNPLRIDGASMAGGYMGALVCAESVKGADNPDTGVVSFMFTGEGGTFRNDVKFKVIGDPFIKFEKIGKYSGTSIVEMISGDGLEYDVYFKPMDFIAKPEVTVADDGDITVKLEELEDGSYHAVLTNGTSASEDELRLKFVVRAENEEEKAEGEITVVLYPEGLSVRATYDDEGRLIIKTDDNEDASGLDPKIKPARMDVTLAIIDKSGEKPVAIIADMKEVTTEFSPITGSTKEAKNLCKTFKYRINSDLKDNGIFYFEPEITLPEPEGTPPYIVSMKISCEFSGQTYNKELTIRLLGEVPDTRGNWEHEYELLKRAVNRYGLSASGEARELIRTADKRSANELMMIRRAIIIESAYYYTAEADQFRALDAKLEKMEFVCSVLKWFGDQAFSYLVTVYGGGPAVDAFISPLKDYYVQFIGEVGVKILWGEEINFGSVNLLLTLEAGIENTLVNFMTGLEAPTPKKIGALVASFGMLNFAKHYCYTENSKGDIYKTLVNMGGDITVNGIKALAASYMDKFLKAKPDFSDSVNSFIKKYIKKGFDEMNGFDILRKYLEEVIGVVGINVYQNITSRVEDGNWGIVEISIGDSSLTFDITANLKAVANMFYDIVFKDFSLPGSPAQMPDTPVYYKS
ncbi:MAG: hypothetical protein ACOX3X_08040 [Eubacteriales bacterium]